MASDNRRIGKVGKTQIKAVYDQVKAEAGAGGYPLPGSMQAPLFDKFLAKFLTWYRVSHAASSLARYTDARRALIGYFRGCCLSDISGEAIEEYKRHRRAMR